MRSGVVVARHDYCALCKWRERGSDSAEHGLCHDKPKRQKEEANEKILRIVRD
jgi:hypothetical protein